MNEAFRQDISPPVSRSWVPTTALIKARHRTQLPGANPPWLLISHSLKSIIPPRCVEPAAVCCWSPQLRVNYLCRRSLNGNDHEFRILRANGVLRKTVTPLRKCPSPAILKGGRRSHLFQGKSFHCSASFLFLICLQVEEIIILISIY